MNKPIFMIDKNIYDSDDFDLFREIVADQNGLEFADETIQKDVRDEIQRTREYRRKLDGKETAGLEDQAIALSIFTGWDLNRIFDMSIRKFTRSLMRANHMIYQDKYLGAELGGMVSFKDKSVINGWLAKIDQKDNYADAIVDVDSLQNKVSMNEAIQNEAGKYKE